MKKAVVIGLTGQTGAGKSSFCDQLKKELSEEELFVVDCDIVSREVLEKEKRCLAEIILEFGCEFLTIKGELDRKKLGGLVFADKKKLKRLNQIIFPFIIKNIKEKIASRIYSSKIIILDAPTLFESGANSLCSLVVSVIADEEIRLKRIMERDDLSYSYAKNRIASQHGDDFYKQKSSFVVTNNGDISELQSAAKALINIALQKGEEIF